ncbi:hypothetical protein HOY80DRAFT_612381 [Tuber brumale]|nr:hypothetical protein HOY80DRAFT_612381 [Tuber brumale]
MLEQHGREIPLHPSTRMRAQALGQYIILYCTSTYIIPFFFSFPLPPFPFLSFPLVYLGLTLLYSSTVPYCTVLFTDLHPRW